MSSGDPGYRCLYLKKGKKSLQDRGDEERNRGPESFVDIMIPKIKRLIKVYVNLFYLKILCLYRQRSFYHNFYRGFLVCLQNCSSV